MALIKVGASYINTNDVQMIGISEKGQEEKQFGIVVQTRFGKYQMFCDSKTERNEQIERILKVTNGTDENMAEIRRQLAAINSRINSLDRKLAALKEGKQ